MKMSYWQKVKLEGGFYEDIERVFPVFWKLHRAELARTKKRQTKGAMLKPTGDHKTSLSNFCQLVIAISKGKKENTLSTPTRMGELEHASITKDLILMEFVKFEDFETLTGIQLVADISATSPHHFLVFCHNFVSFWRKIKVDIRSSLVV